MFSVTVFHGNHKNTDQGYVEHFEDFEQLANWKLLNCHKGIKHAAYFVRGELDPVQRNDKNLATSRLLVVDADIGIDGSSAPSPDLLHRKLKILNFNHIIYTTHSHSSDTNKYRILIPTDKDMVKDDLDFNIKLLLRMIGKIGWVKEMGVWSQPWFFPTRDDPQDGLFCKYVFLDGEEWDVQEGEAKAEAPQAERVEGASDLGTMYANITSGKEYHESILNITWQLTKDGMSKAHIVALVQSLIAASPGFGDQRSMERFNDVERLVKDAIAKQDAEEFDIEGIDSRELHYASDIPIPPGNLGKLYKCAYDSMLYQYHELALVNCLGLIAGIAGRKFNVMEPEPTGLNLYMTVVAPTGFGKAGISKFFNMILRSGLNGKLPPASSFLGPTALTSDKAIHRAITDARSKVCIVGEAGLLLKVKSGSPEAKMAFLLDAYGNSHRDGYTGESVYSSAEDSLMPLRAPAISMISESTMDNLAQAYNQVGALESGYLPRQSMLLINERKVDVNQNSTWEFPEDIVLRLEDLINTCKECQAQDDPNPHELRFDPECKKIMMDFIRECNIASRDADNRIKQAMFTRMAVKAIRYSGIATVFNKDKTHPMNLIIEREELDWAIKLVRFEMDTIGEALGQMSSNEMQEAIRDVLVRITQMITNKATNRDAYINADHRSKKVIPVYGLAKYCATSRFVKALSDSGKGYAYKEGLDKVIDYMVTNKVCRRCDINPVTRKKQNCIQLMENFNEFCKLYE